MFFATLPMNNHKRYVSERQWWFLLENLPAPRQKRKGRKRCQKEALLLGILQVLKTGCRWRDVISECSGVSCWRYFNELQKRGTWERVFQLSIKLKYEKRKGQRVRKALDCKVVKSPRFKTVTGYSKRHRMTGTKISLEVDEKGGVDGIIISKGNVHDRKLAESTNLDSLSNGAKKAYSLTADKGYDDGDYRKWLRSKKIRHAIPERVYGKRKRRRGRPFGCNKDYYEVRYVIERTNGWVEGFRRLKFRYERKFSNFMGMVLLASILMNVRLRK